MRMLLALVTSALLITPAFAGVWKDTCMGCHNGSIAKSTAKILKAKYKTKEEFIKAAKSTNNPMMNSIKSNPQMIEEAAKELYGG